MNANMAMAADVCYTCGEASTEGIAVVEFPMPCKRCGGQHSAGDGEAFEVGHKDPVSAPGPFRDGYVFPLHAIFNAQNEVDKGPRFVSKEGMQDDQERTRLNRMRCSFRRCVDCLGWTGSWCDACEDTFEGTTYSGTVVKGRAFCTHCEADVDVCKVCRMVRKPIYQACTQLLEKVIGAKNL